MNIILNTSYLKESMYWSTDIFFYLQRTTQKQTKQNKKLSHRNNNNTRRNRIDQFLSKQPRERILLYIAKELKVRI